MVPYPTRAPTLLVLHPSSDAANERRSEGVVVVVVLSTSPTILRTISTGFLLGWKLLGMLADDDKKHVMMTCADVFFYVLYIYVLYMYYMCTLSLFFRHHPHDACVQHRRWSSSAVVLLRRVLD